MRLIRAFVLASGAWLGSLGGCAGPKFTASDCDDADCAGAASGGSATGGSATGGSATGGSSAGMTGGSTSSGGSNPGGASGTGGGGATAGGPSGGTGGASVPGFPRYGVLDDFNREGPALGVDWTGGVDAYELVDQTLTCGDAYCPPVVFDREFGPEQEVFGTLASFSAASGEINLILKAQDPRPTCDFIEVLYMPNREQISLHACWETSWHTLGTIDIALEPGDQLGGRLGGDGLIELFRNGVRVGRFDANDIPFIGLPGRIGVNGLVASDTENVWDDFGGGGE